ncbi:MAG: glycine cleavage system aminomethyltransferase GcvT [Eubacteriales bacterium]
MDLKTALYDWHVAGGGKMVPFAGYLLPVQYETGIIAEHMAVRTKAGLFDVSHMGEVLYEGKDALVNLNRLLTNDFSNMVCGQVRYSLMCNEQGGVVDDLIVYKYSDVKYMVVVNAANRAKDVRWMQAHAFGEVDIRDISDDMSQIALQGPLSTEILKKITDEQSIPKKYYYFNGDAKIRDVNCIISYTGYTGEVGYEIYMPSQDAPAIWELLLEAGKDLGLLPCGLGARDTLRLEASMPLYGHELDEDITPFEAGLHFAVKMEKDDFLGKSALERLGPPKRKRVGLTITGRGIVREHTALYVGTQPVGITTSGTYLPYLGKAVAMALIDNDFAEINTTVEADVRGRRITAEVTALPFYKIKR